MPPTDSVPTSVHLVEFPEPPTGASSLHGQILALLCPEEQARMATFRASGAAWEYGCSHAALRIILSRYLDIPPTAVAFDAPGQAFVPPRLSCPATMDWQLSLSHSAPLAAIAISGRGRIGIDIEHLGHASVALEGQRLYMTDAERRDLIGLPPEQRAGSALRTWCLKEAVLKATGQGLALDPRQLSLDLPGSGEPGTAWLQGSDTSFDVRLLPAGIDTRAVVALAQDRPAGAPRIEWHRLESLLARPG